MADQNPNEENTFVDLNVQTNKNIQFVELNVQPIESNSVIPSLPITIDQSQQNLLNFDIMCVETNFLSPESSKLFMMSLVKYAADIKDNIRVVFFINDAMTGHAERRFDFLLSVKKILIDFHVEIIYLSNEIYNKYNIGWGKINDYRYRSISHGGVIYEYLKNHSDGVIFTLLCHSDTEILQNLSPIINKWQSRLQSDPKLGGICLQKVSTGKNMFMNSWFSFWKTPILYEYAVIRDYPMHAIDERDFVGGRFYDTGAYMQSYLLRDYELEFDDSCIVAKHWEGMTSYLLYGDREPESVKISKILERIEEIRKN